jgi:tight adherence protein C
MMPDQWLSILLLAAASVTAMVASVLLLREARQRDFEGRVIAAASGRVADQQDHRRLTVIAAMLHAVGAWVMRGGKLYSSKDLVGLETMIAVSGYNPRRVLPVVVGGKVMLTILIPAIAAAWCYIANVTPKTRIEVIGAAIPLALLAPEWILSAIRRPYANALSRGVIDALDLLIVCSEAGLGLESAIERVARELRFANRPTAMALDGLLDELRVLPDRRDAFANFARRTGVDGMQRLATMLAQSQQYGTPLGQALRSVAADLRRDRLVAMEARAAKLPAKLVMPLILFVMPCLIIILVGSAFLRLFDFLGSMAH